MWRHDVKTFRRMWKVIGNKMRTKMRTRWRLEAGGWRLEAESKALDGNNGGREVVGCVMAQLAC
jgi:hypothetical protein